MPSPFLPLRTGKAHCLFLNLYLPRDFKLKSPIKAIWLLSFLAAWCLPLSEHCNEVPLSHTTQDLPCTVFDVLPLLSLYLFTACMLHKHHSSTTPSVVCNAQLLPLFHLRDFTDLSCRFSCCSRPALPCFMSFYVLLCPHYICFSFCLYTVCYCPCYWHSLSLSGTDVTGTGQRSQKGRAEPELPV